MEEEAREILKAGVMEDDTRAPNLAESIRQLIEPLGGVELTLPIREPVRRPPKLAK
jgi:antitoxin FitA